MTNKPRAKSRLKANQTRELIAKHQAQFKQSVKLLNFIQSLIDQQQ